MASGDIVTLAQAKAHLRIPATNTDDDQSIQNVFIPAVSDVVRAECGDVIPKQYDENYDGGDFVINLRHIPVLSIELIQEGWGWTDYTLDYVQVNSTNATSMFAYSIDSGTAGSVSRRSAGNVNIPFMAGNDNIRVLYTAGRTTTPGAVTLATLELLAHWWQGSQQRAEQYQATGYDAMDVAQPTSGAAGGLVGINIGIPYRVLELLRPYRHMPYIG